MPDDSEVDASWLEKLSSQQSSKLARHLTTTGKRSKRGTEIKRTVWKLDGKEMMRVSAGEFFYGTDKRIVFLDDFWIDRTPITNLEYSRFLEANPDHPLPFSGSEEAHPYCWNPQTRTFPKGKADHPVVLVNFHDVQAYADWVGKLLPTEQQWEKAARGTDGRKYPWGGMWRNLACNTSDLGLGQTTGVGKLSPIGESPYGCVDMSGNVWEWTASNFSETTIVLRGGSWRNGRFDVWCTLRSRSLANTSAIHTGFRLILPTIVRDE
jgi:formylglycine-generating enzyme required for sulfatase activity